MTEQLLSWLVPAGGIAAIFILVWRVSVRIERRITSLEGRIKNLEENALLTGWRDFQILQARRVFDPNDKLKEWEAGVKPKLQKRTEKDVEQEDENTS